MRVQLINQQQIDPIPLAWLARLARRAAKTLRISQRGTLPITFVDRRTMTRVNRRFTGHNRLTDVLSFRYPQEDVVGEILIAPAAARAYAKTHLVSYREELGRYVVHGLLHWLGHEDRTPAQQRKMRALENKLLTRCAT